MIVKHPIGSEQFSEAMGVGRHRAASVACGARLGGARRGRLHGNYRWGFVLVSGKVAIATDTL